MPPRGIFITQRKLKLIFEYLYFDVYSFIETNNFSSVYTQYISILIEPSTCNWHFYCVVLLNIVVFTLLHAIKAIFVNGILAMINFSIIIIYHKLINHLLLLHIKFFIFITLYSFIMNIFVHLAFYISLVVSLL